MSFKLKILGLGLLAMMATSAVAVMNASATVGGHFTADPPTHVLKVKGTEQAGTGHQLTFTEINKSTTATEGTGIQCTHAGYHGELTGAAATTTQSVQVRPTYSQCLTAGAGSHNVTVHVPAGCGTNVFEFKSGHGGTVNLNCTITITHPNCTIQVKSGQKLSGITYHTVVESNKHAFTLTANVKHITGEYHSGICVFLGTTHHFEMVGSATVWGEDKDGNRVNITHTAT